MTKKHFQAIADELRDYPFTDPQDRINIAFRLGGVFKQLNPRFDMERFRQAVTPPEE